MTKKKTATFLITLEWYEEPGRHMTAQIARDKILTPIQELWMIRAINKFSLEEVEQHTLSLLTREDEQGERKSFYKTTFPRAKKTNVRKPMGKEKK